MDSLAIFLPDRLGVLFVACAYMHTGYLYARVVSAFPTQQLTESLWTELDTADIFGLYFNLYIIK